MIQFANNSKLRTWNGASPPHSAFRPSRAAFTLVELLIVISIISVLATMSVSLLASASNDAKISATKARLSQITAILQLQMEDYEVRRLPIPNRILSQYVTANPITAGGGPMNSRLQLKYLRRQLLLALIESEMPRPVRTLAADSPIEYIENDFAGQFGSAFDLSTPSVFAGGTDKNVDQTGSPAFYGSDAPSFTAWLDANYQTGVTIGSAMPTLSTLMSNVNSGVGQKFRRQVDDMTPQGQSNFLDLPAEYLHEILRSVQIDGQSAVEMLGNSAIDDVDGDGIPEVVDAWGDPLLFDLEQFSATVDTTDNSVRSNSNGFVPLDPRYPMALGDIRLVVGSSRIPESMPVLERISKGVE